MNFRFVLLLLLAGVCLGLSNAAANVPDRCFDGDESTNYGLIQYAGYTVVHYACPPRMPDSGGISWLDRPTNYLGNQVAYSPSFEVSWLHSVPNTVTSFELDAIDAVNDVVVSTSSFPSGDVLQSTATTGVATYAATIDQSGIFAGVQDVELRACNSLGCAEPLTRNLVFTPHPFPDGPESSASTYNPVTEQVTVTWGGPSDASNLDAFFVCRRPGVATSGPCDKEVEVASGSIQYADSFVGTNAWATYTYTVSSCSQRFHQGVRQANAECVNPTAGTLIDVYEPKPAQPLSIDFSYDQDTGYAQVAWTPASDRTLLNSFDLRRCPSNAACQNVQTRLSPSTDAILDTNINGPWDVNYTYQVRACRDRVGPSNARSCSSYVSSPGRPVNQPRPPAPTQGSYAWVTRSPKVFALNWSAVSGTHLDHYEVNGPGTSGWQCALNASNQCVANVLQWVSPDQGTSGGTKIYEVRACNQQGGSNGCSSPLNIDVVIPAGSVPEAPTVNLGQVAANLTLSANELASTSSVGALAGEFRVDESGNATYAMPIPAPAGSGGAAPSLSLAYSSQAGNGALGVGWSIGGMSVISRCAQTKETDNVSLSKGVSITAEDRFCLDGQRLLKVGSGAYQAADSEYRLEIDPFTRVYARGTSGTGPMHFEVQRRDGSVSQYGNSPQSRIAADSGDTTQFAWALNKTTDSAGNAVDYFYCSSNGADNGCPALASGTVEFHLSRAKYSGGEVLFEYGSRTDEFSAYVAGSEVRTSLRLEGVQVKAQAHKTTGLSTVRYFDLAYEASHDGFGRSLLGGIQECAAKNTHCQLPTSFTWLRSHNGISASAAAIAGLPNQIAGGVPVDIDGDGKSEWVYVHGSDFDEVGYLKLNSSGTALAVHNKQLCLADSAVTSDGNRWQLLDVNRDNRMDFVYANDAGWQVHLGPWNGCSGGNPGGPGDPPIRPFSPASSVGQVSALRAEDFNGDGRPDLVFNSVGSIFVSFQNNSGGFDASERIQIELDPSLDDILINAQGGGFIRSAGVAEQSIDFDLDGRADSIVRVRRLLCGSQDTCPPTTTDVYDAWFIGLADGDKYKTMLPFARGPDCTVQQCTVLSTELPAEPEFIRTGDINGDGLSDLIYQGSQQCWRYQLNDGSGQLLPASTITYSANGSCAMPTGEYGQVVDYNGDGLADWLYPTSLSESSIWYVQLGTSSGFANSRSTTSAIAGNIQDDGDITAFIDLDGDAKLDLIRVNRNSDGTTRSTGTEFRMGINTYSSGTAIEPANVITQITNGFGAQTIIDYAPMADSTVYQSDCAVTSDSSCAANLSLSNYGNGSPVYDIVAPMFLVSRVASTSPGSAQLPECGQGAGFSCVLYAYRGAKLQAGGRGFLGFREIETVDPQSGIVTVTSYKQEHPFIGMPASTIKLAGATIISEATNTYQTEAGAGGSVFPYLRTSDEDQYDLAQGAALKLKRVLTTNTYDNDGNATVVDVRTYNGTGGLEQSQVTTNVFDANQVASCSYSQPNGKWHQGRLFESSVGTCRGTECVTRTSQFCYDNTTGILNQEIAEPGNALEVTTTYGLDARGNRTTTAVAANGQSRTTTAVYDAYGRYVDEAKDAKAHTVMKVVSRDKFGNPTRSTNQSGLDTYTLYDHLGRAYATYDETGAGQQMVMSLSSSGCPSGTAYQMVTTTNGAAPDQYSCYDALGRTVRAASKGFSGLWNQVDTQYDNLSRVSAVSEPFTGSPIHWTETQYDALGRPEIVIQPNRSLNNGINETHYDGLTTYTRDVRGQVRRQIRNALGELVQVDDNPAHSTQSPVPVDFRTNSIAGVDLNNAKHRATVTYGYHPTGKTAWVQGPAARTDITYDVLGNKITVDDADKGLWRYYHNGYGELVCQRSANGTGAKLTYDANGRLVERRDLTSIAAVNASCSGSGNDYSYWGYNNNAQLTTECSTTGNSCSGASVVAIEKHYRYDPVGRPTTIETIFDKGGANQSLLTQETTYDAVGRAFQEFDGVSLFTGVQHSYNADGYLLATSDVIGGQTYLEVTAMDARNNLTDFSLGNNIATDRRYRASDGTLTSIVTKRGTTTVQSQSLQFSPTANLEHREIFSGSGNWIETFSYDPLNRLTNVAHTQFNGQTTNRSIDYDNRGNITSKYDVGSYINGIAQSGCGAHAGPHAVTRADNKRYCYDANGNRIKVLNGTSGSQVHQTVDYAPFDKPSELIQGSKRTQFDYAPDRARFERRDYTNNALTKTTNYLAGVERIETGSARQYKRYVNDYVLITANENGEATQLQYLTKDHLGSIDVILSSSGQIDDQFSFDAFGKRRDINDPLFDTLPSLATSQLAITTRGFTGHQQLDDFGLIHMNGRIYDPHLGRFAQADPFVQAPENSQSLNRYSYVLNNPLSYTDPSGFFFKSLFRGIKKYWRQLASIAITAFIPGGGFLASVVKGFAAGAVGSGSLRGGLFGAFSAGIFHGIGSHFDKLGDLSASQFGGKILSHSFAGGVMSHLQGGKFGHGFVSAGATQAGSKWIGGINDDNVGFDSGRVVAAAVVGGSVSAATGGKFANGAVTGAFSRAFNDEQKKWNNQEAERNGYREYDPSHPKYHDATSNTFICDSSQQFGCSVQNVYENGLLRAPAPFTGLEGQVKDTQVLTLKGFGSVEVLRFDDEFRIVNATLSNHKLHPGYVERRVLDVDGAIFVRTRGVGIGNFGLINSGSTALFWQTHDQSIIRNLPGLFPRGTLLE